MTANIQLQPLNLAQGLLSEPEEWTCTLSALDGGPAPAARKLNHAGRIFFKAVPAGTYKIEISRGADVIKCGGLVVTSTNDVAVVASAVSGTTGGEIPGDQITYNTIVEQHIVNNAITEVKIADGAVTSIKIADGSVTFIKIDATDPGGPGKGGGRLSKGADGSLSWRLIDTTVNLPFGKVGAGAIAVGEHFLFRYDDNFEVQEWDIAAATAGTIEFDIRKGSGALVKPIAADSICGGNGPALAAMDMANDAVLAGWSPTLEAGRWLDVVCTANDTIEECTLALKLRYTD